MPVYKLYIKEQSGNDLVDYQVRIQLENIGFTDWANLTADSIYFTDANGNPLYFWIEYLDTTNKRGVIWVKIPSIPKNSTVVINLNYGGTNPYPSYHDPKNVFVFFDHFDDPTETMTPYGSATCSWQRDTANSIISALGTQQGAECFLIKDCGISNAKVSVRARQNYSNVFFGLLGRFLDNNNWIQYLWRPDYVAWTINKNVNGSWSEVVRVSASLTTGAWYRLFTTLYSSSIKFFIYKDDFTLDKSLNATITELVNNTGYGFDVGPPSGSAGTKVADYDYIAVAKHVDPDPAVVGENQLLSLGSIYYDYQEFLITGSIYYDGIEALGLGSIYYDGVVGLNIGSIYYDGIEGLGLGSIYYDGITGLNIGSIYYDGIEAVAPPTLPPQILCPEFADILSQEGYSWEKAIASILCGLEAVLTELGNEISRSAKIISIVFIGIGFGYALMRIGEKIIMLVLKGLRKSYEKKR